MRKNPFSRKFTFRSDSRASDATPTRESSSTWSTTDASASDAEMKEVAPPRVDKEVDISRDETFGLFTR
jgi:hypothetical protein